MFSYQKLLTCIVCSLSLQVLHVYSRALRREAPQWVTSWTAAPQDAVLKYLPPEPFNKTTGTFQNTTLRQTLHVSLGGPQIRLHISNVLSDTDLSITAITVALPDELVIGGSSVRPDTIQPVTFSGLQSFTVSPYSEAVSDTLDFAVESDSNMTVTIYLEDGQTGFTPTTHIASHVTSWLTLGNEVDAQNFTDNSTTSWDHWFFISSVDVSPPFTASTMMVIGDSITDGTGSTMNGNNRRVSAPYAPATSWTDQLFARLQTVPETSSIAIANQGIGGNRVLRNGTGPSALSRFGRDVLSQAGVSYVMIYEGINDIRQTASTVEDQASTASGLMSAYQALLGKVRERGLSCFIATLAPNNGSSGWDEYKETTRQAVNAWIRANGAFDAVVDFDEILRAENGPAALNPEFSTSDHLHPNVAGYKAIADNFPLSVFS